MRISPRPFDGICSLNVHSAFINYIILMAKNNLCNLNNFLLFARVKLSLLMPGNPFLITYYFFPDIEITNNDNLLPRLIYNSGIYLIRDAITALILLI
jgi:hypothetical protein